MVTGFLKGLFGLGLACLGVFFFFAWIASGLNAVLFWLAVICWVVAGFFGYVADHTVKTVGKR